MAHHNHNLTTVSAVWLLPIVSTIVAAASGGIVASVIPSSHPHEALITLITSHVLWGTGFPLAMCELVIYFLRLSTQSLRQGSYCLDFLASRAFGARWFRDLAVRPGGDDGFPGD